MVRGVPANSSDTSLCSKLAHAAVHGAMAGFTGFSSGNVNNKSCYIPLSVITGVKNNVDLNGHEWNRMLSLTG